MHVCDDFISLVSVLLSVTINYTTDLLTQSKHVPLSLLNVATGNVLFGCFIIVAFYHILRHTLI